jgi:flagella basal body P-ring formation protein FlgA
MSDRATTTRIRPEARRHAPGVCALTIAIVLLAIAGVALADRVTLRNAVAVDHQVVTLADIATIEGDYAASLADTRIARLDGGAMSIGRDRVVEALDARGVHWGRIALRGRNEISVERRAAGDTEDGLQDPPPSAPEAEPIDQAEAQANPAPAVDAADAGRTLRQTVRDWVEAQTRRSGENLKIDWHHDHHPAWERTDAGGRFEIDPVNRKAVGRVPLVIRQYRDDKLVETFRLGVDVQVRSPVVVATRRMNRGQTITADELKTETRWLDAMAQEPVTDASKLVGMVASRLVRKGQVLTADDARPALLVRRGQLVTLRVISGGLVIKTVARALDEGGRDELIALRDPRTRRTYHARVSGPQQAVMIAGGGTPNEQQTGGDS